MTAGPNPVHDLAPPETRSFLTDRGDDRHRLDNVLARHLAAVPGISRTRIQGWIDEGRVSVDGAAATKVAVRVRTGQAVAVALPGMRRRFRPAPESLPLEVLYEDADVIAVNKPAGRVVHPSYRNQDGTLLNALIAHVGRDAEAPRLLQRLDKDTSGIVLAAKSAAAARAFARALAEPSASKRYLALVHGRVAVARGRIDLPLARHLMDRRRVVVDARRGRPSVTVFIRLGRARPQAPSVSLLECRLVTGRTHQIRVHLSARGWPIVGDGTYGARRRARTDREGAALAVESFPRQALHAWQVELTHPFTGRKLSVTSPTPADISDLLVAVGISIPAETRH